MPRLAVILPAFNAAATIHRAVRSILDQTLRDIELIVVDDGSSDETPSIVASIDDPRLTLIRSDHRGVAAASNTALDATDAEIVARMDADDVAHPERLAKQVACLEGNSVDVVGSRVRIVDADCQRVERMARYERWINEETMTHDAIVAMRFVEMPIVNPTITARRAYFEMRYRENDLPEDYDLLLRAAAAGLRFGKVEEVLLDWTDGPSRLTRTDGRYTFDAFDRCRRVHLLEGPLAGECEVDLWGVGKTGKPWLRWLLASGITVRRAYDIDARKVGETIHCVRVLHPDEMTNGDGPKLIIAVGAEGARELIKPHIDVRGRVIGDDAWFVA